MAEFWNPTGQRPRPADYNGRDNVPQQRCLARARWPVYREHAGTRSELGKDLVDGELLTQDQCLGGF